MIEWVMIVLFQPYGLPVNSLTVPGFDSEQTCHDAVRFVEATYGISKATCVQIKK